MYVCVYVSTYVTMNVYMYVCSSCKMVVEAVKERKLTGNSDSCRKQQMPPSLQPTHLELALNVRRTLALASGEQEAEAE